MKAKNANIENERGKENKEILCKDSFTFDQLYKFENLEEKGKIILKIILKKHYQTYFKNRM